MTKSSSWGDVAEWYDAYLRSSVNTIQAQVLLPNLLRCLAITPADHMLDVGCGQGFFTKAFFHAGAQIVGVDVAPELIEIAQRDLPDVTALSFVVAPAQKMSMIADISIDKITAVLSLQNMESINEVMAECSRVLRPHGKMCVVLNHPAFRVPHESEWGFDAQRMVQYRRVDRYLSELQANIDMHPGNAENKVFTTSFHRPLQFYGKAFRKAGFAISNIEEWISPKTSDSGPRADAENRSRKEIPMFLFLEVIKRDI